MEIILIWLGLALVVGVAANTRGRSGIGWFFLAVLISPLIAGLLVLALPKVVAASPGRRKCPFCAEPIRVEAKLCPHCRSAVPELDAVQLAAIKQAANPPIGTDVKIVVGVIAALALFVFGISFLN
jgi:hypothetical protein